MSLMSSWWTGKHLFYFQQLHLSLHTHTHTHTLPLSSLAVSLSLPPPYPHLFLEDDMGDPDVTSHWPMVSREGLDWFALSMPLLLKTPELLSPTQQLNTHEKEQQRFSARPAAASHTWWPEAATEELKSQLFFFKLIFIEEQRKKNSISDWRCSTMLDLKKVALLLSLLALLALAQGEWRLKLQLLLLLFPKVDARAMRNSCKCRQTIQQNDTWMQPILRWILLWVAFFISLIIFGNHTHTLNWGPV